MASSAVRLATIRGFAPDRFKDGYYNKYNKVKAENNDEERVKKLMDIFVKGKDTYMHLLLRDNIGHIENEASTSSCLEQQKRFETIARARQNAIDRMSISNIFSAMDKIIKKYKEELKKLSIIFGSG